MADQFTEGYATTLTPFEASAIPEDAHQKASALRTLVGRFSAAPTQTLRLAFGGGLSGYLIVDETVPDSRGGRLFGEYISEKLVEVRAMVPFRIDEISDDPSLRELQVLKLVEAVLVQRANHEVAEWLAFDGTKCYTTPHGATL